MSEILRPLSKNNKGGGRGSSCSILKWSDLDSDTAIAVTIRRGIAIVNDKQEDIDLINPGRKRRG